MKLQKIKGVSDFNETINSEKAVVAFSAPWCGPCVALAPTLVTLAEKNPNVSMGKVILDDNMALAQKWDVRSIPTILFFQNGKLQNKTQGNQPLTSLQKLVNTL